MNELAVRVDGRATDIVAERQGDVVWLPASPFASAVGAEFKKLEQGPWAVCRGDLCISLEAGDLRAEGSWVALAALAEPLELSWQLEGQTLMLTSENNTEHGLGIGQVPPAFELPDLHTGALVSSASFAGRKTFFYMWASW